MKKIPGRWMGLLALWLNTAVWVGAESPRSTVRISIMADGGFLMNGTAASGAEVRAALEKLSPEAGVVQLHGEREVADPTSLFSDFGAIRHRGLPVQFAAKSDFSDITANTPAMRIHVDPDVPGSPKIDFTGCVSDACPVHHEKMAIGQVGMFREPEPSFVPMMNKDERDARFPFRGAAIAGVFFMEKADVYVCPTCSREFEAVVRKNTETPQSTGKWTTYVSMRGVPKDLRDAFMAQVPDGTAIADAGERFAFGCVASPNEPRRRFILAGIQGNIGFLVWCQGGFSFQTLAATFIKSKEEWKANSIPDGGHPSGWKKYFDVSLPHYKGSQAQLDCIGAIEAKIAGQR